MDTSLSFLVEFFSTIHSISTARSQMIFLSI